MSLQAIEQRHPHPSVVLFELRCPSANHQRTQKRLVWRLLGVNSSSAQRPFQALTFYDSSVSDLFGILVVPAQPF